MQVYSLFRNSLPDVIGPLVGIGLGLFSAYGALGLEVSTSSGVESAPEPALAIVGLSVLVLNTVWLFAESIETLPSGITGAR
jgi:hypothetical protein